MAGIELRAWSAQHPVVVDLVIASVVAIAPVWFEAVDAGEVGASLDVVDVAASLVAFVLIMLRRRAPLPVLGIALIAGIWSLIPDDDQPVLRVAACLALYTVASTTSRKTASAAGAVSAATLFITATVTSPSHWYDGDNLELIAWTGVATAAGDAVRSRRAYTIARQERAAALEERAERAERALEEEARRRVVEERLRIARELHDVMAHHIAVINVQAGVAHELVLADPAGAQQALDHVRRGASSVLDELSGILNVMRQPDDTTTSVDPLPTIEQLDTLIAELTTVGLDVEWHSSGIRQRLAPAVSLAAYRIIQESLTNAHRHGHGLRAVLRVDHQPGTLSIEVLNALSADRPATGRRGHGTIGMRERVTAAGGSIQIGPTGDGQFRVQVTLPTLGDEQ